MIDARLERSGKVGHADRPIMVPSAMLKRTTLASADSAWAADGEQLDITNIVVTFATQWCESANERPMRLL